MMQVIGLILLLLVLGSVKVMLMPYFMVIGDVMMYALIAAVVVFAVYLMYQVYEGYNSK